MCLLGLSSGARSQASFGSQVGRRRAGGPVARESPSVLGESKTTDRQTDCKRSRNGAQDSSDVCDLSLLWRMPAHKFLFALAGWSWREVICPRWIMAKGAQDGAGLSSGRACQLVAAIQKQGRAAGPGGVPWGLAGGNHPGLGGQGTQVTRAGVRGLGGGREGRPGRKPCFHTARQRRMGMERRIRHSESRHGAWSHARRSQSHYSICQGDDMIRFCSRTGRGCCVGLGVQGPRLEAGRLLWPQSIILAPGGKVGVLGVPATLSAHVRELC